MLKNVQDEFPNSGIWEGPRVLATRACEALKQESMLFSFIINTDSLNHKGLLVSLKFAGCRETHRMYESSFPTAPVLRRAL